MAFDRCLIGRVGAMMTCGVHGGVRFPERSRDIEEMGAGAGPWRYATPTPSSRGVPSGGKRRPQAQKPGLGGLLGCIPHALLRDFHMGVALAEAYAHYPHSGCDRMLASVSHGAVCLGFCVSHVTSLSPALRFFGI